MNTIISRALCTFRAERAATFAAELAKHIASVKGSDAAAIHIHKAITAAADFYAACDELGMSASDAAQVATFDRVWDRDIVEMASSKISELAEAAYERADAAVEEASLQHFHEGAFGDAA
jgi:hypothetical protein